MFLSDFALQQMKGTEHMKQVSSDHSINTENQRLEKKKKNPPLMTSVEEEKMTQNKQKGWRQSRQHVEESK